jgi:hypothetical protein
MFFQDGLTGSAWSDWALYIASPLRAFENELGVQAPVGFWDPAGFAADGSTENFARRRQTEIKHGLVAMLAAMGYITPEITGKLPGYLSPSAGLKFADVPNGLAAISKVPAAGWGQILAYMAFCETSQDQSPGTAASKGDFGFKVLTSSDPLLHLPPGLWRPLLLDGRVGAGASELHEKGLLLGDNISRGGCCSRAHKGCAN